MKESEVWPLATEIWEKREKIGLIDINERMINPDNEKLGWGICIEGTKIKEDYGTKCFETLIEVRRFLDGLEQEEL